MGTSRTIIHASLVFLIFEPGVCVWIKILAGLEIICFMPAIPISEQSYIHTHGDV